MEDVEEEYMKGKLMQESNTFKLKLEQKTPLVWSLKNGFYSQTRGVLKIVCL
jgi:hypothetical protein